MEKGRASIREERPSRERELRQSERPRSRGRVPELRVMIRFGFRLDGNFDEFLQ